MKEKMSKFWAWILLSSEDPNKASLTIKSTLTAGMTYLVFFTGLFHYTVNPSDLTAVIDQVGNLAGALLMVVSVASGLYGLTRKILISLTGNNKVINTNTTL